MSKLRVLPWVSLLFCLMLSHTSVSLGDSVNASVETDALKQERKSVLKFLSYTSTVPMLSELHTYAVNLISEYPEENYQLFLLGDRSTVLSGLLYNLMTPEQFDRQVISAPFQDLYQLKIYKYREALLDKALPSAEELNGKTLVVTQLLGDTLAIRDLTPDIARVLEKKGIRYQFEYWAGNSEDMLVDLEQECIEKGMPLRIHYHKKYADALEHQDYNLFVGLFNPMQMYDLKNLRHSEWPGSWAPNPAFKELTDWLKELESKFAHPTI